MDFSGVYTKQFLEELDPEYQALVKGKLSGKKKKPFVRGTRMNEIKRRMELNMKYLLFGMNEKIDKPEIWQ